MNNAIAIINNSIELPEEDFTVNEMTNEDYINCINKLKREMAQLQNQYNALARLTSVIQRQRNKYIMQKLNPPHIRRSKGATKDVCMENFW